MWLGGRAECVGHLDRVPKAPEGRFGISERRRQPPQAGLPRRGGACRFGAPRRGTRNLGIDSRLVTAVFIRIWTWSCIDRSSSRGPLLVHPAALCPPHHKSASATREERPASCGLYRVFLHPGVDTRGRLPLSSTTSPARTSSSTILRIALLSPFTERFAHLRRTMLSRYSPWRLPTHAEHHALACELLPEKVRQAANTARRRACFRALSRPSSARPASTAIRPIPRGWSHQLLWLGEPVPAAIRRWT